MIRPNYVYVIPPNTKMTVAGGVLRLTPRGRALRFAVKRQLIFVDAIPGSGTIQRWLENQGFGGGGGMGGAAASRNDSHSTGTSLPPRNDSMAASASCSALRPALAWTGGGLPARSASSTASMWRSKVAWKLRSTSLK